MSRGIISSVALAVAAATAGQFPAAPAEAPQGAGLRQGIEQLFETGWRRTPDARQQAAAQFDRLERAAPADPRVPYAYALIQIYQYRYSDAAKLLDRVLAARPENLPARKTRLWLAMLLRDFDAAMVHADRLSRTLPDRDAPGDAELPYREAADLLGRVCAYLAGPGSQKVPPARVESLVQTASGRLTSSRRAAFDEARQEVLAALARAAEQVDATRAAEAASAVQEKDLLLAELDQRGRQLAADAAAAGERIAKVREEFEADLAELQKRDRQLVAGMQRLEAEGAQLRREVLFIEDRIAALLDAAEAEEDPLRRQHYRDEAAHWRLRRDRLVIAGRQLDRQFQMLTAERMKLKQQGAVAQAGFQHELRMAQNVHQAADRLAAQRDQAAAEPITPNTARVVGRQRRAVAFRTYVPLPINLEEEKRLLLEQ